MDTPERLNWELRDAQGNIVAATQDKGVAEMIQRIFSRTDIYDCYWAVSHRAWFPCDFSAYFREKNPSSEVVIEGTKYTAERRELDVLEVY